MFKTVALVVILIPALLGGYMLFAPMKKLIAGVAWMRLPMPEEGSAAHLVLKCFWRGLGILAWLMVAVMIYVLFVRRS